MRPLGVAVIHGIGVDLVTVSRVRAVHARFGPRFERRVLTDPEREELAGLAPGTDPARFLAKRYAVKEAAVKALGTGERAGVLLKDFGLAHDALGKPELTVEGVGAERCARAGVVARHVSLSDELDAVVAFVVLERAP